MGEPSRIVFVYPSSSQGFCAAADLAHREPRKAFQALIEGGDLQPTEEGKDGDGAWYASATYLEPSVVFRHASQNRSRSFDHSWHCADFCIALHVCQRECEPQGDGEAIRIQLAPIQRLQTH